MLRRYAAVTSGVLALACSGSRPREWVVDSSSVDFTNAIEYRALTRADFLSSTRPEIDSEGYVIRAYTCTMLMATPDTWINAVSRQTPAGEPAFGVTFKALGFRALMNRDCSWWNDEGTVDAAYVLEPAIPMLRMVERRRDNTVLLLYNMVEADPGVAGQLMIVS